MEITKRKATEEQLRHAQRMEAVGQLTGGIAHDFNNILGIVIGNLHLLQRRLHDDPHSLGLTEAALQGAGRGVDITRKLLGFSGLETNHTKSTAINSLLARIEELIAKSLTVSIHVEMHLADDSWPVEINGGDLEDAILNLSLNARDAMPDGGTLLIETENKILDQNYVERNPSGKAGAFVMISVSDTGTGMTEQVKEKLFEPFLRPKTLARAAVSA